MAQNASRVGLSKLICIHRLMLIMNFSTHLFLIDSLRQSYQHLDCGKPNRIKKELLAVVTLFILNYLLLVFVVDKVAYGVDN